MHLHVRKELVMNHLRRPLGHVMAAVDFTAASHDVVDRVARLPITRGSLITLLHVVPEGLAPPADVGSAVERARAELEAHATRLSAKLGDGVSTVVTVLTGRPAETIVQRAHDEKAELVVMARHQRGRDELDLIGSTAEHVFHKGTTPVLIVQPRTPEPYRRALVAVDLSATSRAAADTALRLLAADALVRVLHVSDGRAHDVSQALLDFLAPYEAAGVAWNVVTQQGHVVERILADAEVWRPDLLVLGSHGHSKLVQQLVGSVADRVVRKAPCDVVIAHLPRPARL
jgi:nucleotide-binding universal stress UspA family protein